MTLHITGDDAADRLLTDDPLALLIGMLLDQQVAMETAFAGPLKIRERVGSVDAADPRRATTPTRSSRCSRQTPAVHRFPGSMAGAGAGAVRGDRDRTGAATPPRSGRRATPTAPTVLKRLKALPGFGEQKAKIFLALLGKQYGFNGAGWREAAGAYGEEGSFRSVADIVSPESLTKVREHKRAMKAAAKGGRLTMEKHRAERASSTSRRSLPPRRREDAEVLLGLLRRGHRVREPEMWSSGIVGFGALPLPLPDGHGGRHARCWRSRRASASMTVYAVRAERASRASSRRLGPHTSSVGRASTSRTCRTVDEDVLREIRRQTRSRWSVDAPATSRHRHHGPRRR